jgi:3,4-dihydroxy 2-butanone 4-phosphate synthase/GTP cyclohydrolase II|tara:strand:- start:4314 stop:5399 length:1086 start_codon:yes stop_codon:yes gene_type:complete
MLSKIEDIIEDFKNGKMVIMVDDESRENEGDFIISASKVKPEDINFMTKHARGLICLTLTKERCEQLKLPLMKNETNEKHKTNFTLSIEASEGVTTGISAYDRAHTIRTAVKPDAVPGDLNQPGHIFPLMAQAGGVLTRAGHTEAGCDLARIAGFEPSAVIVEILSEDGTMARLPELQKIADKHDFKIGSIEDLIKYRVANEKTVKKVSCNEIETDYGEFNVHLYQDLISKTSHLALVKGDIDKEKPTLVRVHVQNTIQDIIHTKNSKSWPLENAIKKINNSDAGVLLILRWPESKEDLENAINKVTNPDFSKNIYDRRALGVGGQILFDLNVGKMMLMSAPQNFYGLGGFGLEIVDYVTE